MTDTDIEKINSNINDFVMFETELKKELETKNEYNKRKHKKLSVQDTKLSKAYRNLENRVSLELKERKDKFSKLSKLLEELATTNEEIEIEEEIEVDKKYRKKIETKRDIINKRNELEKLNAEIEGKKNELENCREAALMVFGNNNLDIDGDNLLDNIFSSGFFKNKNVEINKIKNVLVNFKGSHDEFVDIARKVVGVDTVNGAIDENVNNLQLYKELYEEPEEHKKNRKEIANIREKIDKIKKDIEKIEISKRNVNNRIQQQQSPSASKLKERLKKQLEKLEEQQLEPKKQLKELEKQELELQIQLGKQAREEIQKTEEEKMKKKKLKEELKRGLKEEPKEQEKLIDDKIRNDLEEELKKKLAGLMAEKLYALYPNVVPELNKQLKKRKKLEKEIKGLEKENNKNLDNVRKEVEKEKEEFDKCIKRFEAVYNMRVRMSNAKINSMEKRTSEMENLHNSLDDCKKQLKEGVSLINSAKEADLAYKIFNGEELAKELKNIPDNDKQAKEEKVRGKVRGIIEQHFKSELEAMEFSTEQEKENFILRIINNILIFLGLKEREKYDQEHTKKTTQHVVNKQAAKAVDTLEQQAQVNGKGNEPLSPPQPEPQQPAQVNGKGNEPLPPPQPEQPAPAAQPQTPARDSDLRNEHEIRQTTTNGQQVLGNSTGAINGNEVNELQNSDNAPNAAARQGDTPVAEQGDMPAANGEIGDNETVEQDVPTNNGEIGANGEAVEEIQTRNTDTEQENTTEIDNRTEEEVVVVANNEEPIDVQSVETQSENAEAEQGNTAEMRNETQSENTEAEPKNTEVEQGNTAEIENEVKQKGITNFNKKINDYKVSIHSNGDGSSKSKEFSELHRKNSENIMVIIKNNSENEKNIEKGQQVECAMDYLASRCIISEEGVYKLSDRTINRINKSLEIVSEYFDDEVVGCIKDKLKETTLELVEKSETTKENLRKYANNRDNKIPDWLSESIEVAGGVKQSKSQENNFAKSAVYGGLVGFGPATDCNTKSGTQVVQNGAQQNMETGQGPARG